MKGGLLAGLYALRALRSTRGGGAPADWLPFARLTFVANPDEEIGSPSSTPLIERAARDADVAFVLESARENGDIVSARKGIADFRLTVRAARRMPASNRRRAAARPWKRPTRRSPCTPSTAAGPESPSTWA